MEQLQQWLKDKCAEQNLSWREVSLKSGLNPGAVSAIMGGQVPGLDSCKALAKFFRIPLVTILQMAGHIEEPALVRNSPLLTDPRFHRLMAHCEKLETDEDWNLLLLLAEHMAAAVERRGRE